MQRNDAKLAYSFLRPYRYAFLAYAALLVVGTLVGLAAPLLIRTLIDDALPRRKLGFAIGLAALAGGTELASYAIRIGASWFGARTGGSVIRDVRARTFASFQALPTAFFVHVQSGQMVSRLTRDVGDAQSLITGLTGTILINATTLVGASIAMAALDWRVAMLALCLLPLALIPSRRTGKRLRAASQHVLVEHGTMSGLITEYLNPASHSFIASHGVEETSEAQFHSASTRVARAQVQQLVLTTVFNSVFGISASLATVSTYAVGAALYIHGRITIGTLVALATYAQQVFRPGYALLSARSDYINSAAAFRRLAEVIDAAATNRAKSRGGLAPFRSVQPPETIAHKVEPAVIDEAVRARPVEPCGDSDSAGPAVTMENVWFSYHRDDYIIRSLEADELPSFPGWALKGVTFKTQGALRVALVGRSGAGKSSVFNVLSRLYTVQAGTVKYRDREIGLWTPREYCRRLAMVSQDAVAFNSSVRSNITFGVGCVDDNEVLEACSDASFDVVLARLPDGLDTIVGDRGFRLSGGERQRLAIARALIRKAEVVLLDEATAHLDSVTEEALRRSLDDRWSSALVLTIAHRLSTVMGADQIVLLEEGVVTDVGTHDLLLDRSEEYRRLCEKQLLG